MGLTPTYNIYSPDGNETPLAKTQMESMAASVESALNFQRDLINADLTEAVATESSERVRGDAVVMNKVSRLERTQDGIVLDVEALGQQQPLSSGRSDYAIGFADSAGFSAGGFTSDATLDLAKPLTVNGRKATVDSAVSTEWAFAVADSKGRVAFGVRADGTMYANGQQGGIGGDLSEIASNLAGLSRPNGNAVVAIGDSLTYGFFDGRAQGRDGWPETLKTLTSATVTNAAMSGYTVDESGIRAAFIQPLVSVEGGTIPASGDVSVTLESPDLYDWQNRNATSQQNFVGSLAGVQGRLKRSTDGVFTFSRTTPGEPVAVPAATPFVGEFAGHWGDVVVVFLGRNNVARNAYGNASGNVVSQVVDGIKRIIAGASVDVKHVLVVSVTTGTWETSGSAGHTTVTSINKRLAEEFPTRFYDLREYLVKQAIYDLGVSPTPEDIKAMEGDTLPPSIMAFGADGSTRDGVHYSRETARLVGQKIFEQLHKRGWVQSA